jgi:hypothetical protein
VPDQIRTGSTCFATLAHQAFWPLALATRGESQRAVGVDGDAFCLTGVCPRLFFTVLLQLTESTLSAARSAVKAATGLWGSQSLALLEAEDRLSVACEKGDTSDEVLLQLRRAYQVNTTASYLSACFGSGFAASCMMLSVVAGCCSAPRRCAAS